MEACMWEGDRVSDGQDQVASGRAKLVSQAYPVCLFFFAGVSMLEFRSVAEDCTTAGGPG